MKIILCLAASLTLASCQSEKEPPLTDNTIADIKTYIESKLAANNSDITLDSLRFIRLDTITAKDRYKGIVTFLNYDANKLVEETEDLMDKLKLSAQIRNLSDGLDRTLYQTYQNEVKDGKEEVDKKAEEIKVLSAKIDKYTKLQAIADSIKPEAYNAVFIYQIRLKDRSIKKDTSYRLLNLDKNIIEEGDFYTYQ